MVVTPLGAILDWTMGTPAGFAAFRDPRVNAMLKKILTAWCEFLDSPDSLYVSDDSPSGWKCAAAERAVGIEQFEHDPADEHWGFSSWNDFFTRRFKDGQRPVAGPDDDTRDRQRLRVDPVRNRHRRGAPGPFLDQEKATIRCRTCSHKTSRLISLSAATIYQAFLSATNFHRWHSPVAGTIVRAFIQEGTYYSEADSEGSDAVEPTNSQSYMAHTAARAIIVIEADNPVIGLVAFVPVGMSEVSSCIFDPSITPGYHLAKGEELGYSSSAVPRTASSFAPA